VVDNKRISKLLSLILRHRPDEFGLQMDEFGYVPLDEVVGAIRERYPELDSEEVQQRIEATKAHRFEINENGIRALYGHSFFIEMDIEPMDPPELLYMGTTQKDARRFKEQGILSKDRSYVHLSMELSVAESRSSHLVMPCVIQILAGKANQAGIFFYPRGEVVLSTEIPAEFVGEILGVSAAAATSSVRPTTGGQSAPAADAAPVSYGRKPRRATGRR
jgi:putative RNA 2'-phosphotransferase